MRSRCVELMRLQEHMFFAKKKSVVRVAPSLKNLLRDAIMSHIDNFTWKTREPGMKCWYLDYPDSLLFHT